MSDKRQRARVQGSWATAVSRQPAPSARSGSGSGSGSAPNTQRPRSEQPAPAPASWGFRPQTSQTGRDVPPEKVIEQPGDYQISTGPSGVSRLQLLPGFLPPEEADWMFSKLLVELPWSQKTNVRQGQVYEEPRLTCWFGELPYTYAHSTMAANTQWHPLLLRLRDAVQQVSGCSFNSLLCNLYRDGHDSIGWHSDDEASLGARPTIASLSLGDTRVFSLRKQPLPEENGDYTYVERVRLPLSHGTLLLMGGATQDDWQHQVAKEYHDRGPRINLTFRTIFPEPEGHRPGTKLRLLAGGPPSHRT